MDLTVFVPILVALIGGGAVAFYTARPRKDSIIAEASKQAVDVVNTVLERLEEEMTDCLEQVSVLEANLAKEMVKTNRLKRQVRLLSREVRRLGGDPSTIVLDTE